MRRSKNVSACEASYYGLYVSEQSFLSSRGIELDVFSVAIL